MVEKVVMDGKTKLSTEKTYVHINTIENCIANGCLDEIPPCQYTTANERSHAFFNNLGARWSGPQTMLQEELEFVSDYTFTKRPIEGMITSAAKFEVMRKRNDPIIETGITHLPPRFGDGFKKLHRTIKIPIILGVDVLLASETIFRRERNIRITRTLLPMRH